MLPQLCKSLIIPPGVFDRLLMLPQNDVDITSSQVSNLKKSLKRGCSPGADGICAEHLIDGASDILYNMLSSIYSAALSWGCVPEVCLLGIIADAKSNRS